MLQQTTPRLQDNVPTNEQMASNEQNKSGLAPTTATFVITQEHFFQNHLV